MATISLINFVSHHRRKGAEGQRKLMGPVDQLERLVRANPRKKWQVKGVAEG